MATERHVTSSSGLIKFQAAWILLNSVCSYDATWQPSAWKYTQRDTETRHLIGKGKRIKQQGTRPQRP